MKVTSVNPGIVAFHSTGTWRAYYFVHTSYSSVCHYESGETASEAKQKMREAVRWARKKHGLSTRIDHLTYVL